METKTILGIHSNVKASDDYKSGHAWISVSTSGYSKTYGLWPDAHPRTKNNGLGSDVRVGMEPIKGLNNRYYQLTVKQEKLLTDYLARKAYWRYTNTCASWSSEIIYYVTREDVDADDWFGFETPRELSRNIRILEAKTPTSLISPKVIKVNQALFKN